jgi:hypothetical protein
MKSIQKFLQSTAFNYVFGLLAFVFVFTIYYPGHKAMLIDDGISGIWEIQQQGFNGFLNSYGTDGLYHGHYIILSLIYAVFGLNPMGWFIVFTLWHAFNALLLFQTMKKFLQAIDLDTNAIWISLGSAVLFLISPYQSENILWAATSHYAFTMSVLLISLQALLDYSSKGTFALPGWLYILLFAVALFTLEISFLFPFILFLLFVLLKVIGHTQWTVKEYFIKVLLPQGVLLAFYLGLYKWRSGRWIPHDRAGADAEFSLPYVITTLTQQIMKLFGFIHQLDYKLREKIYGYALHWKMSAGILGILILVLLVWLWFRNRKLFIAGLFTLLSGLLLYAPFVRVYFMFLMRFENDRYAYFASAFLFTFFVIVLFSFHRLVRAIFFLAFAACSVYFIFPSIVSKAESGNLHATFLQKFPDQVKGDIYLLNVPVYCNESYMFRSRDRFPIAYQAHYGRSLFEKVKPVLWYNAMTSKDTFMANKLNDTTYEFSLKTDGSWLWREREGASNYETDDFKVLVGEWGNYTLIMKQALRKEDAMLYFDGKQFKNLNK